MQRGSVRLAWCVTCLLVTSWTARASEPVPTSPESSMLHLTEAEIVSILGPEEHYSVPEIATLVVELQTEARAEIQATAVEAAAEAARPLLAELAAVTAERDLLVHSRAVWRVVGLGAFAAAVVCGILAAVT